MSKEAALEAAALSAYWIHGMQDGSLPRQTIRYFVRALREERFAYERKLLGRELPTETAAAQPSWAAQRR